MNRGDNINPQELTKKIYKLDPKNNGVSVEPISNIITSIQMNDNESKKTSIPHHVHDLQTTITGNSGTTTKLQTPIKINGILFDGSYDITIEDNTKSPLNHKHDGYSIVTHNHNDYSKIEHIHDDYSTLEHSHNSYSQMGHKHNIDDIVNLKISSDNVEQNPKYRFVNDIQLEDINKIADIQERYNKFYNEFCDLKNIIDNKISDSIIFLKKQIDKKFEEQSIIIEDIIKEEQITKPDKTEEELLKEQLIIFKQKLKDILDDERIDEFCEINSSKFLKYSEKERIKKEIIDLTNKISTMSQPYRRKRIFAE